jgi:short-subunit dehydrogenase
MSYALVTGASRGIGKAIAFELASRMYNVLLVARSGDQLKEVSEEIQSRYGAACHTMAADLAQPGAPAEVARWIEKEDYPLSVLVNNAGYTIWNEFEQSRLDEQFDMLNLNIRAKLSLIHHLLPRLHKQEKAWILNVASTSAYQAVPTMSTYAASKAFVIMFSRALRMELAGSGVSVSCISPGTTDTDFMNRANMDALKETAAKFNMKAGEVARIAVKGMLAGKPEIIPGAVNWISAKMTSLMPKSVSERVASGIYLAKKRHGR